MAGPQRRHTGLKRRAAGPRGRTEKPQRGNTRLDARRAGVATEIERSGRLTPALRRLGKEQGVQRVLKVPQPDFGRAVEAARRAGIAVTVSNISGTKRRKVNP